MNLRAFVLPLDFIIFFEFDENLVICMFLAFQQPLNTPGKCTQALGGSAVCISLCLSNFQKLEGMVPTPSQNTLGVYNIIIFLIFYYISSRLVTLLKVIDAPVQVSDIFYLTVSFKFINLCFQIFLLFVPEMSTSFKPYIAYIIYIALARIL